MYWGNPASVTGIPVAPKTTELAKPRKVLGLGSGFKDETETHPNPNPNDQLIIDS